ncbi:hypothetical protein H920_13759 [Fukomys damarensis]|uniref:Uncharacterized protein n=1 Tax=Fukomys damarensis TaxID=885580 RepID=A0A091CYF7_FUKDA|nr:hypothetical protein H920_13759 [Fukomys damarensis]
MLTVKIRAPLMKAAVVPSNSEGPSSSSKKNSPVHIRKTIRSKLLLENQQAEIFLLRSLFMPVGNSLQVGSAHLRILSEVVINLSQLLYSL